MTKTGQIPVLLVDDDEEDYLIVKRIVAKIADTPYSLEWVSDPAEAEAVIAENRHELYLIDYRLGKTNGVSLLAGFDLFLLEQPFILLTGIRNKNIEREATEIGISDYLVKGSFDEELLERVLRYNIQRKKNEAARMQQLQEMNAAKDEFIALASHQLRTPATAVKQYIGILLEGYAGPMSDQQLEYLAIANESNDRQMAIINDLLKTAQLDAKRYRLNKVEVDVVKMLREVIADFDAVVALKSQTIVLEAEETACVEIDEREIRLVLVNLLENASKYSPPNTTIHTSIRSDDEIVYLSVRDEVVGIGPKDLDTIFGKFTRVPNELSDTTSGNGLGLYWVKRIVELHDGTVHVTSEPSKGTTFEVRLPA